MTQKYDTIHELKILDDLIDTVVDRADKLMSSRGTGITSITRSSKDLILTFPVFVSNSMDAKTMMLIAKALESKYATTLLILFNSFNDLSDTTFKQYLKRFHINMGSEIDESVIYDKFNEEMTAYIKKNNPRFVAELAQHKKNIMDDMKNINYVLPETLAENDILGNPYRDEIISETTTSNREKIEKEKLKKQLDAANDAIRQCQDEIKNLEKELIRVNKEVGIKSTLLTKANDRLRDAENRAKGSKAKDAYIRNLSKEVDEYKKDIDRLSAEKENCQRSIDDLKETIKKLKDDIKYRKFQDDRNYELKNRKENREDAKFDLEYRQKRYGSSEFTNGDIKKANEMTPSLITVNYYPNKDATTPRSVMLGVKAKVYPIDSETVVEKLANADRNRGILNLVRATTREISFIKDFLLTIDTIKDDAKKAARNKNSMKEWKKLESRSRLVKINRLTGLNLAQAISTIVITKYEVDQILDRYDIDLSDSSVLRHIMRQYSLLGIVITDPEYETVDLMFDGDESIEQTTNKDLAYRSKNNSDEIVNLIGKLV